MRKQINQALIHTHTILFSRYVAFIKTCATLNVKLHLVLSGRAPGFDSVLPSGPDIAQFKQGVKTVAGKMAVLANGVMNTIQVRHQQSQPLFDIVGNDSTAEYLH